MRRKRMLLLAALAAALLVEAGVVLAGPSSTGHYSHAVRVPRIPLALGGGSKKVIVGHAVSHFRTGPLRSLRPAPFHLRTEHEATANPLLASKALHERDPVVQDRLASPRMPAPALNFDGIAYPGVACNCAPPDTNGEPGETQYVQIVNQGFQVFDKTTGASVVGPVDIATLWPSGTCSTTGQGDPVVLYDQLAGRWMISQFAGVSGIPTDECIAVSTTSDATGSYNAYDFNLGTDYFDYPKLGVWPDAYYMSMNVFDSTGTDFLGPQPFAFDRAAMLAGSPSPAYVTSRDPSFFNPESDPFMPADLDGSTPPPAGAPNPFLTEGPTSPAWPLYRFHVDFATPANSTFTFAANVAAAPFTALCPASFSCVPQLGSADNLDALADRGMFRNAYRNFGNGHEALVGNMTVSSNGVAGIRWFELNHVTSGAPAFVQQSTYQPDSTWRWMGSVAMDHNGDMALGFSASSAAVNPRIGYAGRLVTDPPSQLLQGETTLFQGTGSQLASNFRWGDYSDMTVDPVDDCTFWYTQEYYSATAQFDWRTRIGSFRFPSCTTSAPTLSLAKSADAASVTAGSPIGFTVTLSNTSSAPATGITLTDPLPNGTGISWSVDAANSSPNWSIVGLPPSQTAVFSGSALAAGTSTHVHVVSTTTNQGCRAYPNTASYTADYGLSGQASASTTVTCPPPVKCKVPKVLGLTLAKAKAKLRKAHCRTGKVRKTFSTRRKKGRVVAQKPKAGKRLAAGAKVALWIGKGPRRR